MIIAMAQVLLFLADCLLLWHLQPAKTCRLDSRLSCRTVSQAGRTPEDAIAWNAWSNNLPPAFKTHLSASTSEHGVFFLLYILYPQAAAFENMKGFRLASNSKSSDHGMLLVHQQWLYFKPMPRSPFTIQTRLPVPSGSGKGASESVLCLVSIRSTPNRSEAGTFWLCMRM